MSQRRAALAVGLVLTVGTAQAAADTLAFTDARDPVGAHDVRRLVVANDGPEVTVTVPHRGTDWRGRVGLALDVAGDRRPELTATIPRRTTAAPVFRRADGAARLRVPHRPARGPRHITWRRFDGTDPVLPHEPLTPARPTPRSCRASRTTRGRVPPPRGSDPPGAVAGVQ